MNRVLVLSILGIVMDHQILFLFSKVHNDPYPETALLAWVLRYKESKLIVH